MRFMMIVKANKDSEAEVMPNEALIGAMAKFNEEMVKAGVMLAGDGLRASSRGWRVKFSNGQRTVVEGPFPNPETLIAGYWMIQVKSREEAMQWALRCPAPHEGDCEIEVRQVFELEDFAPSAAIEQHRALQDKMAKRRETK